MMCKLLFFVQSLNYICSVVILTVISLERYVAINHPMLNRRFPRKRAVRGAVAMSVWLISVFYSLPNLIAYDTAHVDRELATEVGGDLTGNQTIATSVVVATDVFCYNSRPIVTRVYIFVNFGALYVTPLLLMTFVYTRISIVLWRSGLPMVAGPSASHHLSTEAQRTRTARGGSLRNPSFLRDATTAGSDYMPVPSPPRSVPLPRSSRTRWTALTQPTTIEVVALDSRPQGPVDDGTLRHSVVQPELGSARGADSHGVSGCGLTQQHNPLRSRRKVIRLLIAFVVSFAVCMLPNHVWLLWQQWADMHHYVYSYEQIARQMYVLPFMTLLFYVNSCLNPFLYALISDKFRSAVSDAQCLRQCCRRQPADNIRAVAKSEPQAQPAPPVDYST